MSSSRRRLTELHHTRTEKNTHFYVVKDEPFERNDKNNKKKWQKIIEKIEARVMEKQTANELPLDVIFDKLEDSRQSVFADMLKITHGFATPRDLQIPSAETLSNPSLTLMGQFYVNKPESNNNEEEKDFNGDDERKRLFSITSNKSDYSSRENKSKRSSDCTYSSNSKCRSKHSGRSDSISFCSGETSTSSGSRKTKRSSIIILDNIEEIDEIEEVEDDNHPWDLIVHHDIHERRRCSQKKHDSKKIGIIKNFLHMPEVQAARWRPLVISTADLAEKPLCVRVQIIENTVAANFMAWYHSLGGAKSWKGLNEKVLKESFQIGMVNPASYSFKNEIVERPILPVGVAEANNIIEKSLTNVLNQHMLWNMSAEHKKKKYIAFNEILPTSLQFKPPYKSLSESITLSKVPKEIENLSMIFSDVLHLNCLYKFCTWLKMNGIPLPTYLNQYNEFNNILEDHLRGANFLMEFTNDRRSLASQEALNTFSEESIMLFEEAVNSAKLK